MNAFDRPVPTLAQQTQYMVDAVNASGHTHRESGQTLSHSHEGGCQPHGYYGHPEDGAKPAPSPWEPGVNGASKRPWFLIRKDESVPIAERYYFSARSGGRRDGGNLVRYASRDGAQRAADRMNGAELNLAAYLAAKALWERLVADYPEDKPTLNKAEARLDTMKKAAGVGGPGEPLCCQRYSRLHHPVCAVAGCRWYQAKVPA